MLFYYLTATLLTVSVLGGQNPLPESGAHLNLRSFLLPALQSLGAWGSQLGLCPTLTQPMTRTRT